MSATPKSYGFKCVLGQSGEELKIFKFSWAFDYPIESIFPGERKVSSTFCHSTEDYVKWHLEACLKCANSNDYVDCVINPYPYGHPKYEEYEDMEYWRDGGNTYDEFLCIDLYSDVAEVHPLKALSIQARVTSTINHGRQVPSNPTKSYNREPAKSQAFKLTAFDPLSLSREKVTSLEFEITVKYYPDLRLDATKSAVSRKPQSQSRFYERILLDQKFTDIKIIVQSKEFPVHKLIMSARSSYFEKVFSHGTIETSSNSILVEDFDPQVIENMIKFIYTGDLPENLTSNQTGQDQDLHLNETLELLRAADKYEIEDLKIACEDSLIALGFRGKPLRVLELAYRLECYAHIKAEVMKYVIQHRVKLFKTGEWIEFVKKNADIVLEFFETLNAKLKSVK